MVRPIHMDNAGKMTDSPAQAKQKYTAPRDRIKKRKSKSISVSCMNFASHLEGSNSIYDENRRPVTIVTTNGTIFALVNCSWVLIES
jgi:hypothetical protein